MKKHYQWASVLLFVLCANSIYADQSSKDQLGIEVRLAWTASPDVTVTSYTLYWGTASRTYTNSVRMPAIAGASTMEHTVFGLTELTTYYFSATASDADGVESEYSNEVSYTTPALNGIESN